jgi:hypothetical protein
MATPSRVARPWRPRRHLVHMPVAQLSRQLRTGNSYTINTRLG